MITRSDATLQTPITLNSNISGWQQQLREAICDPKELLRLLDLQIDPNPLFKACDQFPLRVPRAYLAKMRPGDAHDPLLLQVLPSAAELERLPGYAADPLGEAQASPREGIIHKYQGRLLLILSGSCAVNCRYCFRRHFPYSDNQLGGAHWQRALQYIRNDTSLEEVIFSGGDPLATSDARLSAMVEALSDIPHLRRLRIHTRLPVMIPDRITEQLITTLSSTHLKSVLVTHCNHPQEIDAPFRSAMDRLRQAGVVLLNQTVLLRAVNADTQTLKTLSERLFDAGILPYYLHVLDPVQGAAHFDVPDAEAQSLVGQLMQQLPGYLVPKLVREVAGQASKTPLMPSLTCE